MASWDLQLCCDTELRLGRRAPAPCAREEEEKVAPTLLGRGGLAATELQAMAILRVARRAAAAGEEGATHRPAAGGGVDGRLSMRKSLPDAAAGGGGEVPARCRRRRHLATVVLLLD